MLRKNKFKFFVICLDVFLLIGIFALKPIANLMINHFPGCIYYSKFGVKCGSCGGTRCVYYFFGGDFLKAWEMNPLFFCAIIYIIVLFLMLNISLFKIPLANKAVKIMSSWQAAVIFGVCYFVFSMLRMFVPSV